MWVKCAAQPILSALYPEPEGGDNEAARWGTALAEICAGALAARTIASWHVQAGHVASNGVMVDDEMLEAGDVYTQEVLDSAGDAELHIEEFMSIPTVHESNRGRMDLWFAHPGIIHVWELKGGHRFVDEFENWQLIDYAEGILAKLGVSGLDDQHTRVVMHVVQPRSFARGGPVREWSVMVSELRPYVNQLCGAAERAHLENPPATINEHCGDCRGRVACEAATLAAYEAAERAYSSVPLEISADATGAELRMLQRAAKMLDARISGLEEQARAQLRMGARIPFFELQQGYGRQTWTVPVEEIKMLGEMLGVNVLKPPALVTPKQAIKAGLDAATVESYTKTPMGEVKLVPSDDRKARRVFG
jgi:Protein of unknown function (DUF2800)